MHALILAAGSSSRLGRPKQLVEWQGRPLLQHAIAAAQTLLADRVSVVLGANATAISAHLDLSQVNTCNGQVKPDTI
jgi:molybdenum cofactor cytidylyltransferase